MDEIEKLCKAYIEDALSPRERKSLEARIANGDQEVIAALKKMQSFKNPARRSDAHPQQPDSSKAGLAKYYRKNKKEKSEGAGDQSSHPEKEEVSPLPSIPGSKFRDHLYKFTGVVIGVLVLVLAYIQWENKAMEQRLRVQKNTIANLEGDLQQFTQQLRATSRALNQIKAIIGGSAVEFIQFEGNGTYINRGAVIWDRSTFRMAMIFPESDLPAPYHLSLWAKNRSEQWNKLGTIDRLKPDSLYMDWNVAALTKVQHIRIQIDSINAREYIPDSGAEFVEITMPE